MAARCVGIHWNSTKSMGYDVALRLIGMLKCRGIAVCVNDELADQLNMPDLRVEAFEDCELLFVLGGDGTILSALDRAIPNDLPILGINLGRLGFLTELEINDLEETEVDRIRAEKGNISLQLRNPEIDNTHLNEMGYRAVAQGVYEQGKILEYWK